MAKTSVRTNWKDPKNQEAVDRARKMNYEAERLSEKYLSDTTGCSLAAAHIQMRRAHRDNPDSHKK